ncbi:RICIN domain-containing protein [Kutzneria sp. CA-103260]|uniref:RICIN domain-containing protein n=1 Tax=Kutzneria sp. CA-103260 TaxID=2802641 RepID=UPI001BA854EF|nr:RICIN domain-containing protein [Kutzneria sp. CA-103260]QUQ64836.1 Ricin-type beta-trefoil lectin domain-like protein [Kutzneria sp. CA-103260]
MREIFDRRNQYYCNDTSADNQLWYLHPTRAVGSTQLYEFVNAKGGLCLDLPNYGSDPAGTHLSVYYCNSSPKDDNQEWELVDLTGNGDYLVVNFRDNLCLDVSGWASDNSDQALDVPLTVYPCYNGSWANGGYDDHVWSLLS